MSHWTNFRKYLNPVHAAEKIVEELNNVFGTDPGGPSGTPNMEDGHTSGNIVNFSTDTLTGPEEQRMMTTAYMDNGGYNMLGGTTAYNEEQKKESSTLDKILDIGGEILGGLGSTALSAYYNKKQQQSQNKYNAEQAELARQFNAQEAEKNRQWETEMANTAHQREYSDLLAAGLNATLTGTGGGGAATPGGSAASGSPASSAGPAYMGYSDMANTALSLAETMKVINENKFISKEKKAQIANTIADTTNKEAGTANTEANTRKTEAETRNVEQELKKLKEETRTLKKNNDFNDTIDMSDNAPQNLRWLAATLKATGVHDALNPNNTDAMQDIKAFSDWMNKQDLGIIPINNLKRAWEIYKSVSGKK